MNRNVLTALALAFVLCGGAAMAAPTHCPPGLAKKAVPCVPPGQVGKTWTEGETLEGDYIVIPREIWEQWHLPDLLPEEDYVQIDGEVLRVLRETLVVLEAIGILDRLLN